MKACEAIRIQFEHDYVGLMPTNLYGYHDNFDLQTSNVLPTMMRKFQEAKLNALRDWGHAKDYVEAMWRILQQETPEDFIIATGKTTSIRDFVRMAFQEIGAKLTFEGSQENQLAKIFNLMGIDTHAVLEAAATKWNFLHFKPCLVGGHCIGVDPYYLAQKAQELGYHPELILAGRRINNDMSSFYAKEVVKQMIQKGISIKDAKVLVLGITYKENCPDIRNTKVVDLINSLKDYEINVDIYDPWANPGEVMHEYGLELIETPVHIAYDAVVLGVAHNEFKNRHFEAYTKPTAVVYDVKGVLVDELEYERL